MRARSLTALIAVAALVCAPAALADVGASANWAGYAVHGPSFHRVEGSWRQPPVACVARHQTFSAYWVGLGGFSAGAQALEQIGTEADCGPDGRQTLSAWYEMVPAASRAIALRVMPGDLLDAAVAVAGHVATLSLRDVTRHRAYRTTVSAGPIDVSSAEWIVEAPSDCRTACVTLPLANFGTAVFTSSRAQGASGHWGPIADAAWSATVIRLDPGSGRFGVDRGVQRVTGGATPSALSLAGSSFSVSYANVLVPRRAVFGRRHALTRAGHLVRPRQVVHPTG